MTKPKEPHGHQPWALQRGRLRSLTLLLLSLSVAGCDKWSDKATSPPEQQQDGSPSPRENPFRKAAAEEAQAIKLAKEARTLVVGQMFAARPDPQVLTNDFQIRLQMSKVKGDMQVVGWRAVKFDTIRERSNNGMQPPAGAPVASGGGRLCQCGRPPRLMPSVSPT